MEFFTGATAIYYLIGVLAAALTLERVIPWRRAVRIDFARWLRNAVMMFYSIIILGLAPVLSDYGAALAAQAGGFGLFNIYAAPFWVQLGATLVVLDFMSYAQHRVLHKWYFFWRTHRLHHADRHIDATTSLRFHPIESVLRAASEVPIVLLLGLPPEGVLLAFGVHTIINTVTHANIYFPPAVERVAALVFITPRMHRLHHSTAPERLHSNFSTMLSIWDRIFGTYCAPDKLRDDELFGIEGPEAIATESFANLAMDPFRTPHAPAIPRADAPGRANADRVADAGS